MFGGFRNIVTCNPPTDSGSKLFGRTRNLPREGLLGMSIGRARTAILTSLAAVVALLVVPSACTRATWVDARKTCRSILEGRMTIHVTWKTVCTRKTAVLKLVIVISASAWAAVTNRRKSRRRLVPFGFPGKFGMLTRSPSEKFTNAGVGTGCLSSNHLKLGMVDGRERRTGLIKF